MRHRFVLSNAPAKFRVPACATRHLCALFALALWACRSAGGDTSPSAAVVPLVSRGDHVVVEPRAAEFFEGRVLSIGKSELRIEPVGKHEGILVSVSDVYALVKEAPAVKPGQFAICRVGERWIGCRVEASHEDGIDVLALNGAEVRLAKNSLLAASAATELNLRRAFGKVSSAAAFAAAAGSAGRPSAPANYRVTSRSRVVARRPAGWFSGIVADVHDDGAHVLFAGENVSEQVPLGDIVPEPPTAVLPARGDFALIRPVSPAEPWQAMRVLGPEQREFKVVGADSISRVVPARDVLPLVVASPTPSAAQRQP
jgi:hypothetical protein